MDIPYQMQQDHVDHPEDEGQFYHCVDCEGIVRVGDLAVLNKHIKQTHLEIHTCPHCNCKIGDEDLLEIHIRQVHTCPFCNIVMSD